MLGKRLQTAAAGSGAAEVLGVEDVFSTYLYTGNGSTQTITNGIDLSGEGGLTWIKQRSGGGASERHCLFDTVRGAPSVLVSNSTDPASNLTGSLTAFNNDGFDLGSQVRVNASGQTFASWTFRKAPGFFDVVTYTGTGSATTVSHNLGSVPGCILVKDRSAGNAWFVYHRSNGAFYTMQLNTTDARFGNNNYWNNTEPTSSVFSVGSDARCNALGNNYVAYLFAHDEQIFGDGGNESVIKCGSFTTDSSGYATVNLGWEPQFVMYKRSDNNGNWAMFDTMRGFSWTSSNISTNQAKILNANLVNPESTGNGYGYPFSTGFIGAGASSADHIYIAIRRGPMKTPTDATTVFKANTYTGNGSLLSVTGIGFPPDFSFTTRRDTASWVTTDKLRGAFNSLYAQRTDAEVNYGIYEVRSYDQDGITYGQNSIVNGSSAPLVHHLFRRAPGFFDAVAYTGTGVARTVDHNLGVVPELMIVKSRSSGPTAPDWFVYCSALPTPETKILYLNANYPRTSGVTVTWNSTNPTSSVFSLGTYDGVNGNTYTYIAYLFATCPGVSKVGSYTGTGTTNQIDCGFAAGARFVLIKRTDSTGDWYVWDTARGIVSGNDPYLLLNSTAAEVTTTDYIDPYSAGFEISSSAPAAINASGGSFIFLAIA